MTSLALLLSAFAASAQADDRVVLRQQQGDKTLAPRFYQVQADGSTVATAYFPSENDTFELLPAAAPGQPAVYRDRFGRPFVPGRPVNVYDYAEVPAALRDLLSTAVQTVASAELTGKPYDKTRVKKKETYIKLPAPTLRNLTRTKHRRILATEEESRVEAALDGTPVIEIAHMAWLKQHDQPRRGVLVIVVRAELPVAGRVRYKAPSAINVSTGYHAAASIDVVTELRAERTDEGIRLDKPEILRIDVRLERLELSNDILDAARRQVRHYLNEEAKRQHDKIRRQANKALAKAVDDEAFRSPLVKFLLPL